METEGKYIFISGEQDFGSLIADMSRFAHGFAQDLALFIQKVTKHTGAQPKIVRYDTVYGEVSATCFLDLPPRGIVVLETFGYDKIRFSFDFWMYVSPFVSLADLGLDNTQQPDRATSLADRVISAVPSALYQDVPMVYDSEKHHLYAPWTIAKTPESTLPLQAVIDYIELARRYSSLPKFVGVNYGDKVGQFLIFGYASWHSIQMAWIRESSLEIRRISVLERAPWMYYGPRSMLPAGVFVHDDIFGITVSPGTEIHPLKSDDMVLVFTQPQTIYWERGRWKMYAGDLWVVQTRLDAESYLQEVGPEKVISVFKEDMEKKKPDDD